MAADPAKDEATASRRAGQRIGLMLLAAFLVVAGANAVFIYVATESHSGVVRDDAYQQGVRYNEVIAAAEAQAALGWQINARVDGSALALSLAEAGGAPLTGAALKARLIRPVVAGQDRRLGFAEHGPGVYTAPLGVIAPGKWVVEVDILWQHQPYHWRKTIVIPQR